MKRNLPSNLNSVEHWNEVYSQGRYSNPKLDGVKYSDLSNHIEDGTNVVDLGCGEGHFLKAVKDKRPACLCVGVDYSTYAIKQLDSALEGVVADVTNTGLPDDGFDYVVSLETLEHLDEPERLVAEMARICKPGGKALLTTPYLDHIPSNEHVWLFDYNDLARMFEPYFKQVWVSPWASGSLVHNSLGDIVYQPGNWDAITVKAIK